ncbi:MAG: hypothetical protein ACI3VR_04000 [Intestinibacter sp.]|uniref:hypothetical protein n=1 Tax=Intestinibacter sp. TaxID=1965304 RepID=UPI003F14CAC3
MRNVILVYDDRKKSNEDIKRIVGNKKFSEIIFKGKTLKDRYLENLTEFKFIKKIYEICDEDDLKLLDEELSYLSDDYRVIHIYSNYVISDVQKFKIIVQKANYLNGNIVVKVPEIAMKLFINLEEYRTEIANIAQVDNKLDGSYYRQKLKFDELKSDCLVDISNKDKFLKFISGGFDARYFNSLSCNDYIVTKKSTNIKKIKAEYQYYHLLPDDMKIWFVMPFNYTEDKNGASYSMERYNMTDLAIRWVHSSINIDEFEKLIKKLFHFINMRKVKRVTKQEYESIQNELYIDKLYRRIEELKAHEKYSIIKSYIENGTNYKSIDEILDKYMSLFKKINNKNFEYISVIGHGDLCFSNILYDTNSSMLKLIDIKGALKEEDLWTNPYYDIAKLSHSICGRYDFFNSGLYEIKLNKDLKFDLDIKFDNKEFVKIFKKYLKENDFDYKLIRLYESSLFLSMTPLHMDYPQKVFGFLLNAINIIEEIEWGIK